MANVIECTLDVLATSSKEIHDIAEALRQPSREFLVRAAGTQAEIDEIIKGTAETTAEIGKIAKALRERPKELLVRATETQPPENAKFEWIRQVVTFQVGSDLGYARENVRQARFEKIFKDTWGVLIEGHLHQVSTEFPSAVFLAEYRDNQASFAWKQVVRNGVVDRSVGDFHQRVQAVDWMLLDIFAPFWAEYENGQPFGIMWNEWVDDLVAGANRIRNLPCSMSCTEKRRDLKLETRLN